MADWTELIEMYDWKNNMSPGQVAQLVRASSQYTKVVSSISSQGPYKKQLMNL